MNSAYWRDRQTKRHHLSESVEVFCLAGPVCGMQFEQVDDELGLLNVAEALEVTQRQLCGDFDTVQLQKVQLGLVNDVVEHVVGKQWCRLTLVLYVVSTHDTS